MQSECKCKFLGRMCWMNCSIEDSQEHVVNSPNMMGGVVGHCVSWLGTCRQVGNSPIENRIIFQIVNW